MAPWGTRNWSYDKIGNRLSETRDGVTDTYSYAANAAAGNTALLTQISLGSGGTKTYQHGPAGHLTRVNAAGNQVLLEIDAEGRLSALERPLANARAEMLYDGRSFLSEAVEPEIFSDGFESGNLACWSSVVGATKTGTCPTPATAGGRKVEPTYSSEGLLHARTAEGVSELVLYFAGRPMAVLTVANGVPQGLTYLTTDHLGTPALATDAAGVVLWSGGFEPFGEDWNGAGSAGVFLRFPGQWDDAAWVEAGLGAEVYYNLYRWYEPQIGRYTKVDPLGLGSDINLAFAKGICVYFSGEEATDPADHTACQSVGIELSKRLGSCRRTITSKKGRRIALGISSKQQVIVYDVEIMKVTFARGVVEDDFRSLRRSIRDPQIVSRITVIKEIYFVVVNAK